NQSETIQVSQSYLSMRRKVLMRKAVLAHAAALIGGLIVLAPVVAPLAAQSAPASTCSIDQNKPKELALAWLSFTRAQSAAAGPARDALLKGLMKDLVDKPEKFKENPGGYNYVLTQVYSLEVLQPGGMLPTTRGALGLTTRPTEAFDVVTELDNAYKGMEAASPSCKADVAQSRTNEAWLALTKRAFDASNSGQADSAVYYANRSMILSKDNPFPHHILATVAQQKNDMTTAVSEWKQVVQLAGTDTSYKDIKQTSQFYLGVNELQEAAKKSGEAQKTQARAAANYLREFLTGNATSPDAPNVMSNLSTAIQMSGDTAQLKGMYADLLANPGKYSEAILTMGGVVATQAKDMSSALKLFQSSVAADSNSRDGLRNLAATHYGMDQFEQMFKPLRMLVRIDPNNFDAVMMFAYASQGLGKATKDQTVKRAWTDSLIKYQSSADSLKAKVEVTGFTRGPSSAEVTIVVEQVAATGESYSVKMEFMNAKGDVIGSDTQSTGKFAKGEKKTVKFKGNAPGIVSFKYGKLG
ncbi:MAG: hypothetical protein ABJB66_08640, partial [Gemmatimonadaceae bacterium]